MTNHTRIARALACAALLAIPASAVGAQATIRIEGTSGTVVPETAYAIPSLATTVTIRDTGDGDAMQVDARTAAAQLGGTTAAFGVGFGFSDWGGTLGFALDSIGQVSSDWTNGPVWFLKVNHVISQSGAGAVTLQDGDEVLWALGPFDPSSYNLALDELDVRTDTTTLAQGAPLSVTVSRYDNDGVRSTAPGATVTYRGAVATTDAAGRASFTAGGDGPATVTATAAGSVRDTIRVCGYPAADPTVCNLPPAPVIPGPGAAAPSGGTAPAAEMRLPVTISTAGGPITVTADIPLPTPGAPPVAIRRSMITGADLSPAEMRRAMGAVASAVAAQLNARAAGGETGLSLPAGVTWQAAWLSGAPYVAPLRQGEALLGIRRDGPRNGAAIRERARAFARHMDRCDIDGTATAVTRHGYAMTAILPARARTAVVRCASGEAPR